MSKRFRFLSYLGLASVCTASYGTPYPSLKDIEAKLDVRGGIGAVVEKVFKEVYQQAEASSFKKSGFEDLKLIGEENGSLTLSKNFGFKDYKPEDYRDWQWRFDTIYGFFSCTVQGMSVFNGETLRKAVEASETDRLRKTMLTRADTKRIAELTKVCRVLLSEEFAKRLMTEPLLKALYDNKDAAYSCFDVEFSPDTLKKNVFRFDVMYSQTIKEKERQAKCASVFVLRFSFGYDFEKHDFGGDRVDNGGKCWGSNQPQLEYLGINRDSVRSNFLNFDDRSMERVWQHPYWESVMREGEEKILREGKEAVDEEKQENPEKSKENLGSEKEEGDWNDVFAVCSNFLNSDERSMECVRQHPCWEGTMCRGEEKILREEKKAVAEEKQENSKKSKGGSEEEEEDLKVHTEEDKEDKASELRDPNKRPRTPDSEDVEAEGSFKRRRV
ncbi:MAG: hypothetical protein IJ793_04120 [Opitutales bacterium]|nr:hypothetical protein [Opitutales bacterium]